MFTYIQRMNMIKYGRILSPSFHLKPVAVVAAPIAR